MLTHIQTVRVIRMLHTATHTLGLWQGQEQGRVLGQRFLCPVLKEHCRPLGSYPDKGRGRGRGRVLLGVQLLAGQGLSQTK